MESSVIYDKYGNFVERFGVNIFLHINNKKPRYIGCLVPLEGVLICCKNYEIDGTKEKVSDSSSLMCYNFSELLLDRSQLFYKIIIVEYFDQADFTGAIGATADYILKIGKARDVSGPKGSFSRQIFFPRYLFTNESHQRKKYISYLQSQMTLNKESKIIKPL